MPRSIYTIGHSNHSIEVFLSMLASREVTAVADVRSQPYSRYAPQFNRENVKVALNSAGLVYVFLGRELGARSEDPACYVDGKVSYDRLARSSLFQAGLARLVDVASTHRIAIVCAEKDPLTCHRAILICRQLVAQGIEVNHILEDGSLESHEAAISRLVAEEGLGGPDLFRTRADAILEAYENRGRKIAFTTGAAEKQLSARPFK